MRNYYAVAKGRIPGIYLNWDDCLSQVKKFKGALYKKTCSENEAIQYIHDNSDIEKIDFHYNRNCVNQNQLNNFFKVSTYKDKKSKCLTENPGIPKKVCPNIVDNQDTSQYYVYTDGACINNGKPNAKAGIGIYFGLNDERNVSRRIIGRQTNNVAELTAIIDTYPIIKNDLEKGKIITIVTDSEYSLKCIGNYGNRMSKNNWKDEIPNKELVKKIFSLYSGNNLVKFKHVNSHTGKTDIHSLGNEWADKLANMSLGIYDKKNTTNKIYLSVPFNEKDTIKSQGGKWDFKKKKWYILETNVNKICLIEKYK